MRKILIGVLFGLVAVLAFGQQTNDSATLVIRGNVPVIVNVNMTASPEAENLTMGAPGAYTVEVGTLQYRSNADFTLSVSPSSSTSFVMTHTDSAGTVYKIPYEFKVNGVSYNPGDNLLSQGRTQGNEELVATIEYTVEDPLPEPGDYEDVLTFSIAGN